MLFVKNTPVDQLLTMNQMIEVIEDALKEVSLGRGFELPRRRIHHANRMIFGLLPGSVHGFMGAYLQTDLDRRLHNETVILYSVESGEPLILFQNCSINESRTGAAGGVGAKYLARRDSRVAAVLGSQAHAVTQLKAAHAVRPLKLAKIFSLTESHRQACAEKVNQQMAIEARAVSSAEAAIDGADIIITATNSGTPVFDGSWLKPGMHVTSVANGDKTRIRQEIDDTTIRRADPIFITSRETLRVNESDVFRAARDRLISWDSVHEIADLLLEKVPGRTDERQITLYKLQGTGIMDVAIAALAYQRLKESNLAQEL